MQLLHGFDGLRALERAGLVFPLLVGIFAIAYAVWLWRRVERQATGTEAMRAVWRAIREGAEAYLKKQRNLIAVIVAVLLVGVGASVLVSPPSEEAVALYGEATTVVVALGRMGAFLVGAAFSVLVGQIGMRVAVQANVRVTAAAKTGTNLPLQIAYNAGTVSAMLLEGLGLIGGTGIYLIFGASAPMMLIGFGLGASIVSTVMRVGGGIYTKQADVGADLAGKNEQRMEEDDDRNVGVVADLVGDNVGDCAGATSDASETYEATMVAAQVAALMLMRTTGNIAYFLFPLLIRAIGVLSSMLGTLSVPFIERRFSPGDALKAMSASCHLSGAITVVAAFALSFLYMHDARPALLIAVGIGLNLVSNAVTAYFTGVTRRPVVEIAKSGRFGPAIVVLNGMVNGLESAVAMVVVVSAAVIAPYLVYGSGSPFIVYGTALVGIGWLTLAGNMLAMDSFGPIVDNAQGIGSMAGADAKTMGVLDEFDRVGNAVKAETKAVLLGAAAVTVFALFGSIIADVQIVKPDFVGVVDALSAAVGLGGLAAIAVVSLFASSCIKAVSRGACRVMEIARAEFARPGVMERTVRPDYGKAVASVTAVAQEELLPLAILTIGPVLLVGFMGGLSALCGFLLVLNLYGFAKAIKMTNGGGAWDNAKKLCEGGDLGVGQGKGTETHRALVVGDTVGDPWKDTAGTGLSPFIKAINFLAIFVAPIIVTVPMDGSGAKALIGVLAVAVVWAVSRAVRPSLVGVMATDVVDDATDSGVEPTEAE